MSSINDKLTATYNSQNPEVATVSSARSIGGTSLSATSLNGWPTGTVHFITYKKTAAGLIDKTTQCDWKAIVSGTTLGTLTLKNGTDSGNDVGDFIEMAPTAPWGQDLYDGLTQTLNVDGTLKSSIVASDNLADSVVTADKLDLSPQQVLIATLESTSSTSYVALTTVTDKVTVTIGANGLALVAIYCGRYNNTNTGQALMTFAMSGANTAAASDTYCIGEVNTGSFQYNNGGTILLTGLTPGSTTFKLKYRANTAGTAYFLNRRIAVVPL
jgi:hypothetical protein